MLKQRIIQSAFVVKAPVSAWGSSLMCYTRVCASAFRPGLHKAGVSWHGNQQRNEMRKPITA